MNDPLLTTHRRLFVRGMDVPARIGVHASEQGRVQRLLVDVDVYVSTEATTPRADELGEVVDYEFVREVVLRRLAQGHIRLLETLCDDVLTALLAHAGVAAARISARKPDAFSDCEAVGVETFRTRATHG